ADGTRAGFSCRQYRNPLSRIQKRRKIPAQEWSLGAFTSAVIGKAFWGRDGSPSRPQRPRMAVHISLADENSASPCPPLLRRNPSGRCGSDLARAPAVVASERRYVFSVHS